MSCFSRSIWHCNTKNLPASLRRSSVATITFKHNQVVTVLESLFEASVDLIDAFLFAFVLELVESLCHLLSDLLGCFQVGHELLLVDPILSIEQVLQSKRVSVSGSCVCVPVAPLFEVRLLSAFQVSQAAANDGSLYDTLLLLLPQGLVLEVHVPADVIGQASHFLHPLSLL
jgi:hypothetical protein